MDIIGCFMQSIIDPQGHKNASCYIFIQYNTKAADIHKTAAFMLMMKKEKTRAKSLGRASASPEPLCGHAGPELHAAEFLWL